MKILCFGSCNIDFVYSVPHFVKPGETIGAASRECFPGGKGLNQSIAIARSGASVYHAGCIGTDGLFLKELLEDSGVNTQYLKVVDTASGHAIIQVDENGENSIILHGGANYMIDKSYIDEVLCNFNSGDIVVLQNEISNVEYIIEKAYEKGMKIMLNPSPFNKSLTNIDLNCLYALILNEIEAKEFSGESVTAKVIEYFRANYKNLKVVLTLGGIGSVYFDKDTEVYCPSFSVKVADTTCAGDTYGGYFISRINSDCDVEDTLKMASAAAALTVSRMGAAASIPYINEVEEAVNTLKMNVNNGLDAEKKKIIITEYIEKNLCNANLDELSKLLGYSKQYSTVWIKENMQTSFSHILKKKRCEKAALLLRETNMPIDDIIKQSGYENGSFFRKMFKENFGKSLLEYRKYYLSKK